MVEKFYILSNGDDDFYGMGFDELVLGLDGDDNIQTVGGDDILDGGDGEDWLAGGEGNDTIYGGNGDDYLLGGLGADILDGGAGIDFATYQGTATRVIVDLMAGKGLAGEADGDTLTGIENLIGTDHNDLLYGNGIKNRLEGWDGDDYLSGRGGADILRGDDGDDTLIGGTGADIMIGGKGDDSYEVDLAGDVVWEEVGGGTDTVRSWISFSIANFPTIENISLLGSAKLNATGNAGKNTLIGNAAANTLTGGKGDDTYYIQGQQDRVIEAPNGGLHDMIVVSVSYNLDESFVENLRLSGTSNINGTGNSFDNVIYGNSGINTLSGKGGKDIYYVQNAGDKVIEDAIADHDIVLSSVTYTQPLNVWRLVLSGSADIDATGNAQDNEILDNSGDNVLDGGAGNDTYHIRNTTDHVIEVVGNGHDKIFSSAEFYTMKSEVEDLTLVGFAVSATGNYLENLMVGNSRDNWLYGKGDSDTLYGGAGDDVLIGGFGADTLRGDGNNDFFHWEEAGQSLGASEDTILDFDDNGNDTIVLGNLVPAVLTFVGTAAFTAVGQVRINDIAGADIKVELNLTGTVAPELIVRLTATTAASMTASDFLL